MPAGTREGLACKNCLNPLLLANYEQKQRLITSSVTGLRGNLSIKDKKMSWVSGNLSRYPLREASMSVTGWSHEKKDVLCAPLMK